MKKHNVSSSIKWNAPCYAHCLHCPALWWLRTNGALGGTPADQVAGATLGCQLAPPVNFLSPAFHWRSPLKSGMQNKQKTQKTH